MMATTKTCVSKEKIERVCYSVALSLGYSSLKDKQREIIISFVSGSDVFAILPTGYGKSLCYACLPSVFDQLYNTTNSVVVVITPLTSIMKDQVTSFSTKGIQTAYVSADQKDEEVIRGVEEARYKIVYFTPEMMLLKKKWRSLLMSPVYLSCLKALVVDEAHTVKQWGESFRKVLLRIGEIRSLVPDNVSMMCLTATATKEARKEITTILGLKTPKVVTISPSKSNIMYVVMSRSELHEAFVPLMEQLKDKHKEFPRTVIYCQKLSDCGRVYLFFKSYLGQHFTVPKGAPDLPQYRLIDMFHSCTDSVIKEHILHSFSRPSHLRVVIATVAFGMGIDCPDVRQIIHLGAPDSIESYIQATGRAGRDNAQSVAVLLLVKGESRNHTDTNMRAYISNNETCRRYMLFNNFEGEIFTAESPCVCCDICKKTCNCGLCEMKCHFFDL